MATSIQLRGEHAQAFRDSDLIAIISLITHELQTTPPGYEGISTVVEDWRRALKGYGPGTIELNLDSIERSSDGEAQLIRVLESVDENIRRMGETIPATILSRHTTAPGVVFLGPYPTSSLSDAIGRLRKMLLG